MSQQLNETIRDAEDFLAGLGLGTEAAVPVALIENGKTEEAMLAWRRVKDGWQLYYEIEGVAGLHEALPLIEVSRVRKAQALLEFEALVKQMREKGADLELQMLNAIEVVKGVMEKEGSK